MAEKTELAPIEEPQEKPLVPVATETELVEAMRRFEAIKAALLVRDRDTYTIEGQERIRKSGWRKLALAFGISDEIVEERLERDPIHVGEMTWHVRVRCWARGGRRAEGVGSASSRERKFAHLEHDLHALAHTRAKNRAIADMLGSSDLIAEEEPEAVNMFTGGIAPRAAQPSPPRGTDQQRVDAGQRAIAVRFLEDVLGEDLMDLVKLEEKDGQLLVILENPMAEANRTRFLKGMMLIGQGVHETSRGIIARMAPPKGT